MVERRGAENDARRSPSERKLGDVAAAAGLRRIHLLAWRDLDDPEAGGSEIHAHEIASRWANAGLDVTMRTSFAAGHPPTRTRAGYHVVRRAGRYMVFPRAAFAEFAGLHGRCDGLVETWNGMPFFSPLWASGPRIVFLHHLHAEMWNMSVPPHLSHLGRFVEAHLAPSLYRNTTLVTLSESSKRELVQEMGFSAARVRVVPPGVDERFSPGTDGKSVTPLVLGVGRLVPVKRFHLLVDSLVELKKRVPAVEAVIVGEGGEREMLEARLRASGADEWVQLPGRVSDDELVELYRRAWVVASTSAREGWGMTLTEAAACGTPSVATDIAGHRDAVQADHSGLLVKRMGDFAPALERLLTDDALRMSLSQGALARARECTWEQTAIGALEALADDARSRR